MIHIERTSSSNSLNSPLVEQARRDAEKFYKPKIQKRKQLHHKFFPLTSKLPGFGEELSAVFNGKCAFCESYLSTAATPKGSSAYSRRDHYVEAVPRSG
jgi:hypothetical protein